MIRNPGLRKYRTPSRKQQRDAARLALPIATVASLEATRHLPYRVRRRKCYMIESWGGLWKWAQWAPDLTREPGPGYCYARQAVRIGGKEVWVARMFRRI